MMVAVFPYCLGNSFSIFYLKTINKYMNLIESVGKGTKNYRDSFNLASPFMLLLFDVFLLAVDETIEHRPFLGNTEIVLNISDCYVIAFGRDAKENAR